MELEIANHLGEIAFWAKLFCGLFVIYGTLFFILILASASKIADAMNKEKKE